MGAVSFLALKNLFSFGSGTSTSGELVRSDGSNGLQPGRDGQSVQLGSSTGQGAGAGEKLVGSGSAETVTVTEEEYRAAEERLALRARIQQEAAATAARLTELKGAIEEQLSQLPPEQARLLRYQLENPLLGQDNRSVAGLERFLGRVTRDVRDYQAELYVQRNPGMRWAQGELVDPVVQTSATSEPVLVEPSGNATAALGQGTAQTTLPGPGPGNQAQTLSTSGTPPKLTGPVVTNGQPPVLPGTVGGGTGTGVVKTVPAFETIPTVSTGNARPVTRWVPPGSGFFGKLGVFALGPLVMALDAAVFEKELNDPAMHDAVLEGLQAMDPKELDLFLTLLPAKTRAQVHAELLAPMS